jgi:hypothetical protein
MISWQPHECVPWVQWREVSGESGVVFEVRDIRPDADGTANTPANVVILSSMAGVHEFAADRSVTERFVPVGDYMKWLTGLVGIPSCGPCEKRRACMNQLLGRIFL